MKSIFEYIDYRKYLKDFYDESKATKKYFSYRYFAQKAGLNAPILLKMVIDGKRNLSRKSVDKFIKGIGLQEKEALYFRNLVLFNQAKTTLEKYENYSVLQTLARQVPQHLMEEDHFEYFEKWYYSVIREGICQNNYKDDWDKLAASVTPTITADQAKEAADWLLANGFLRKKDNGKYEQIQKAITTRSEVRSIAVRKFNQKMIDLAEKSLDTFDVKQRYATGITVGLTREAYDMLVAEIEAFRDRVVQIADKVESPDKVCQVNIQLFPLMQNTKLKDRR